ncbi:hypothetical protein BDP27DRAFT_1421850 [Rhodocollybia butyracea]|uniref:Uncharacterized protein n=1 Tax=Rhodocollybia butyracea TaxID=206335 RepID=A0A9P5U758_9AGAR|nr:hypothetical protein BDP27DRAFT_1421850 [Rhodocollybia butyracea]
MSEILTETCIPLMPPKQPKHYLPLSPPHRTDILDNKPPEVVDIALFVLQRLSVKLIEWQGLAHRRMNVPILLRDYSYLVPDTQVLQASKVLSQLGLPLEDPSTHVISISGDFDSRGEYYRITRHTSPFLLQYIVIYPQSFATISDAELEETTPSHILSPCCSKVFVPTVPAIYASIMRMMLNYPQHSPTMYQLQSDLSELIGYHLLGLSGAMLARTKRRSGK